jgi:hypothetical protein
MGYRPPGQLLQYSSMGYRPQGQLLQVQ